MTTTWPGKPYPLGATWDGDGVNFALFSEHATGVELCLFDSADATAEYQRILLTEQTDYVWHVYLPGAQPGLRYGYRVQGPYEPQNGHRFNGYKLLIDPYARAIDGDVRWDNSVFGYAVGGESADLTPDVHNSAPFVPHCIVVDPRFEWDGDQLLGTPLHRSLIYEIHVKGFTKQHPDVPPELRGSYAGLATPAVIAYLHSLGVTAVELLPVHQHINDRQLVEKGLTNYWGYNTIGFFAPHAAFSCSGGTGEQVREFKAMVKALHAAGIEVILDVVYNHTGEGNHMGPTLSMKGIDNKAYYRLVADNERYYMDYTGTGNTLNALHPRAMQLIMDSLRYWVQEMHVDGFRFDLASALARGLHEADRLSAFFDIIHQDPVLSQVKLIAEPWDVGPGGYQVGNFPVLWSEWNGKYRDVIRSFWQGSAMSLSEVAYRLTGSSDLYQRNGRLPYASINFITAHDGFTLRDLVSYNDKHNQANGEDNNDGESHNQSFNYGVEGPTKNNRINVIRARQQRNLLATLLLSQGVPMLLGGDEFGRTQGGNNNAYCQDNATSWVDWNLNDEQQALLTFARELARIRREHPALQRRQFFQGRGIHGSQVRDVEWFRPDGSEISDEDWQQAHTTCVALLLDGRMISERDERGQSISDDLLLLIANAGTKQLAFRLPSETAHGTWQVLLDTAKPDAQQPHQNGGVYRVQGRSLVLLVQQV